MEKRKIFIYALIVFAVNYIVYIFTTAPGLTFTDSGELAAVCSTLGVAHPTGYPLFTILGHLWTLLPFPFREIYSLNLFAGFLTAISSAVFFILIYEIISFISKSKQDRKSKNKDKKNFNSIQEDGNIKLFIALATALTYGFARTIWAQATAIEVYSLHLLLMNLTILFFVKGIFAKENKKYFVLAALLLGMSFSNHMTTVLLIPSILFLYFKRPKEKVKINSERLKFLAFLFIPFLIGLSFYLYLPIRSAASPEFNWGWVSRGLDKFMYHFSGKQYQIWMFSGAEVMKTNFVKFFNALPYEIAWIGIIPFFYGLFILYKKSKEIFWFLVLLIIVCLIYATNYSIHDIESYFVTAFFAIIIFIGIGLWQFARKFNKYYIAVILIPIISFMLNYSENDQSENYLVPEYTRIMLQKLKPNALIISSEWDYWVSAFWYLQRVEGVRPDVVLIDKELLRRTWYPEQLKKWYPKAIKPCERKIDVYLQDLDLFESGKEYNAAILQNEYINMIRCFIEKNYNNRPIYITLESIESDPAIVKDYQKVADGFAFMLTKDKKPQYVTTSDIDFTKFIHSLKINHGYLVNAIRTTVAIHLVNVGRYALMTGNRKEAKSTFQTAYKIDPKNRFVINAINNFDKYQFK